MSKPRPQFQPSNVVLIEVPPDSIWRAGAADHGQIVIWRVWQRRRGGWFVGGGGRWRSQGRRRPCSGQCCRSSSPAKATASARERRWYAGCGTLGR
jgi:hypothetical protein